MFPKTILKLDSESQPLFDAGVLLPVMEMFYSVQGEGFHTGKAAFFIRIGGCDVGCRWCDVKESWNASLHPLTSVDTIMDTLISSGARSVVITGGEPLMYRLDRLCSALKAAGISIFLETSGAYPISGQFDWICVSPKEQAPARPELLLMADELKMIIQKPDDFQLAETFAGMVKEKCLLFLQPEWSRYNKILPAIVDYVMQHPGWMISLQAHKFMNIP